MPRSLLVDHEMRVSQNLVHALWNRMAADPAFLRSAVPPLSECIPALVVALRVERDRRVLEASRWRPQLDLPAALQQVAVRRARSSGELLDEWLNAYVSRAQCALGESDDGWVDDGYGDLRWLQGPRRRA